MLIFLKILEIFFTYYSLNPKIIPKLLKIIYVIPQKHVL